MAFRVQDSTKSGPSTRASTRHRADRSGPRGLLNLTSLQLHPAEGFTAFLQRTARYWPFPLVLSGRDSSALGCSFALSDTCRTVLWTLSRWRHGFESRWGCNVSAGHEGFSEPSRPNLNPLARNSQDLWIGLGAACLPDFGFGWSCPPGGLVGSWLELVGCEEVGDRDWFVAARAWAPGA